MTKSATAIMVTLVILTGCDRLERSDYPPAFNRLYFKDDIVGIYSKGTGFTGCNIAIGNVMDNQYIVTSQEYGCSGLFKRYSSYGTLINGMLRLDDEITIVQFGEETHKVNILWILNNDGIPSITDDEFFQRISDDSRNVYVKEKGSVLENSNSEEPPNQSLKPSPLHVVFQSPGSGQEFAD